MFLSKFQNPLKTNFASSRNQNIAFLEHQISEWSKFFGAWEAFDCSVLILVIFEFLRMNAVRVVDSTVVFLNAHTDGSITVQVTHGVKTDIT